MSSATQGWDVESPVASRNVTCMRPFARRITIVAPLPVVPNSGTPRTEATPSGMSSISLWSIATPTSSQSWREAATRVGSGGASARAVEAAQARTDPSTSGRDAPVTTGRLPDR